MGPYNELPGFVSAAGVPRNVCSTPRDLLSPELSGRRGGMAGIELRIRSYIRCSHLFLPEADFSFVITTLISDLP